MASICRGLNELKNTVLRNQPHFPVVNELKIYLPFKWAHHILDKNTQTLVLFNLYLTICVCVKNLRIWMMVYPLRLNVSFKFLSCSVLITNWKWRMCPKIFVNIVTKHLCFQSCWQLSPFTHWGWGKMASIFQTSFSDAISWMKMHKFRLRFHWSLLRFHWSLFPSLLTIFQHWFR